MIRLGRTGSLVRAYQAVRPSIRASLSRPSPSPAIRPPTSLALTTFKPFTTSLQRYATADHIDIKHEKRVASEELEKHPDEVSSTSSVHQIFHEQGVEDQPKEKEDDMLAGVKHDLVRPCDRQQARLWLTDGRGRSRKRSIWKRYPRKRSTLA